jgi:hypothetical protein
MCSYLHLHVPLIKCQIEKDYHWRFLSCSLRYWKNILVSFTLW